MEPEQHNVAPAELPQPADESSASAEPLAAQPEQGTNAVAPSQPTLTSDPLAGLPAAAPVHLPVDDATATNQATSGLMADDSDLIEKEWVSKAKAIVAQTRDNPHQQNKQMTAMKADYLKKRYNKDLKIAET